MDDAAISERVLAARGITSPTLTFEPLRFEPSRHAREADGDGYGGKNSDWIKINFKF